MTEYKERQGMSILAFAVPAAIVGSILLVPALRKKAARLLRRAKDAPRDLFERAKRLEPGGLAAAAGKAALRSAAMAGARSAVRQIREQSRRD